ncbi:MAG TPA: prepilin-type N-terminal cleavage/methylation domain-containing protein [Sumerlaeia bacterium]|nr:prepilin-type N-terminal cleavage/methylation domain-containing protein [Sumerlaeia bacterium]
MERLKSWRTAFTLIELLIVVAIIAILAAIAVPNFLEAQVRAKVANVMSDYRALRTALETYRVDNNIYPPHVAEGQYGDYMWFAKLTSPVAYITSVPESPFTEWTSGSNYAVPSGARRRNYEYWPAGGGTVDPGRTYAINSVGPDGISDYYDRSPAKGNSRDLELAMDPRFVNGLYDSTNGTKSEGDILMTEIRIYSAF